jgi:two-component system phosphate regulon response regulator PhoB
MSGHSILIVEDDPGSAEAFVPILVSLGHDVRVAVDAESALLEIERRMPAMLLVDLHLPIVSGIDFLRQVRGRHHADVPAAMMTADYLLDDRLTRELEALAVPLYFKPLWEEDLAEIVERLLGGAADFSGGCGKVPISDRAF